MADAIESFKVICGGGLNSNENHLDLSENSPGSAVRLVNFEPSLFGGYRRIEGYAPYKLGHPEVDPAGGAGAIMSLSFFKNDTTNINELYATRKVKPFTFVATEGQTVFVGYDSTARTLDIPVANNCWLYINGVRKYVLVHFTVALGGAGGSEFTLLTPASAGDVVSIDVNEYGVYRDDPAGWTKLVLTSSTGQVHRRSSVVGQITPIKKIRDVKFNFGAGNSICFVDGANPALIYDGQYWDAVTSTGSGTAASGGGSNCLDYPSIVDVFKGHLFFSGDPTEEAKIAHASANNPYDWVSASSGGSQVGGGQVIVGFDIVAFKAFRDDLFVFGENSIKKIVVSASGDFAVQQVTNNVGCMARDSVLEIGGDLMFLAPDGLRPVAGTSRIGDIELETISKPIQQLLRELPSLYDLESLCGVVVRSKSQVRYFIDPPTVSDQVDSFGIIGGLRSADQRLGWEFGELIGIRASCAVSAYINNIELVLHGDYNGKIYRQENKDTSFDGAKILAIYATPFFDFGETEVRKVMRKVNTFVRAEGPYTMNMAINYDWNDPSTAKPNSYAQTAAGSPVVYKGLNITYSGAAVSYGGTDKPIMTTDIQGSGQAAQATFVTFGDSEPYSIQGIVFEFSIAGRL
mgnify:CR=1 FL=1|jgi:hypothetical protein|tara:strand:- start:2564 stop:4459 length:1896 start_codon:yes stop_codon:yes gene_type:complete